MNMNPNRITKILQIKNLGINIFSRYSLTVIIFLIFCNNISYAGPYVFGEKQQTVLSSVVGIMGIGMQFTNSDFEPLAHATIDNLMEKELLKINQIAVDSYNDNNALISDILLGLCLAIPAGQVFDGRVISDWGVYGMMYLGTVLLSGELTSITKSIFREPRPYIYNPDVSMVIKQTKDGRQSFFSGHSCLAFAGMTLFAETYSKYYPDNSNHNLIWLGSMSLATTTALLRVFSGRHFPIDVLVGSAVGILVGKLVTNLHENNATHQNNQNFQVTPIMSINLAL